MATSLTPKQRWMRGIAGVALLLLYPSCHVVRFYWDTEAMFKHMDDVLQELERKPALMERTRVPCGPENQPDLSDASVYSYSGDVECAISSFSYEGFADDYGILDDRYKMWDLDLGVTRPMRELYRTLEEVRSVAGGDWAGPTKRECKQAPENEIKQLEAKMAAIVKRHAARLRSYLPTVRRLAAEHNKRRPVLAGMAWTLLLIEIAGGVALLWLVWDWRRRRLEAKGPPPAEDPHWRTSEAGEQAPRSSPWPLVLFIVGVPAALMGVMLLLAQSC